MEKIDHEKRRTLCQSIADKLFILTGVSLNQGDSIYKNLKNIDDALKLLIEKK